MDFLLIWELMGLGIFYETFYGEKEIIFQQTMKKKIEENPFK